jgi:hypothetical protein
LHNWSTNDGVANHSVSPLMQDGLRATQDLIKQSLWGPAGIKHTKDFLLSLGSGQFLDQGFDGFLVLLYGGKTTDRSHDAQTSSAMSESLQFIPLQPSRQPSIVGIDADILNEPDSKARPSNTPLPDSESGTRPRAESRTSTGSRRSTFPEIQKERGFAPDRSAMGPPDRDLIYSSRTGDTRSSGWRPSAKSFHGHEPARGADATDDVGYYSAPSRSNTGITFTAVSDSAFRESEQRTKIQRRDSRGEDFGDIVDAHLRDIYKADNNGRRENHRGPPGLSLPRRHHESYALNRFQNPDSESPYPLDSYYRHQLSQASSEELFHKRRHGSPDSRQKGDGMTMTLDLRREQQAKKGLEEGTMTFALSERGTLVRKPKRRELSKEQREHAAAVRRLGACPECKARKIKVGDSFFCR